MAGEDRNGHTHSVLWLAADGTVAGDTWPFDSWDREDGDGAAGLGAGGETRRQNKIGRAAGGEPPLDPAAWATAPRSSQSSVADRGRQFPVVPLGMLRPAYVEGATQSYASRSAGEGQQPASGAFLAGEAWSPMTPWAMAATAAYAGSRARCTAAWLAPFTESTQEARRGAAETVWSSPKWHKSAETVGILSQEDHVFTKTAGPRHKRVHDSGAGYELATICMVFDASLRCCGIHSYRFCFMAGELGPADGAGFVFDTRVRRRPLGQMRAVFMNQRGFVCLRRGQNVSKLPVQLPRLDLGMYLTLSVNLDRFAARFDITDASGQVEGSADVSLEALFEDLLWGEQMRSGFFCAVVTGNITVGLY